MNACRTFLGWRGQKEFTRIFEKRPKSEGSQNRAYWQNLIVMAPSWYKNTLLSGLKVRSKSTGINKIFCGEAVYSTVWMKYTFIAGKKNSHSQTIPVKPAVLQVVECIITAPSSWEFMSLPLALTHCASPLCMVMDDTPAATRTAGTSAHHAEHPENSALLRPSKTDQRAKTSLN